MAEGLTPVEAALVSLSAAIAVAGGERIATSVEGAVRAGAPPRAIYETLLQSYLFLGFPRAIEAFFAAKPALDPIDGSSTSSQDPGAWRASGEALCQRVYGANFTKLVATMQGLSPDLASWMIVEGYGKTLSRPGLDARAREYCVVAILAATGMWRQLRSHAIGAVNVGGTRAGVREAIERTAEFTGEARVREALRVVGMERAEGRSHAAG